ncbi:MAG: DUF6785 family protein [Armatimonadota bacterium]
MNTSIDEISRQKTAADQQAKRRYERVTLRAILLALVLTVVNDYWLVQLEVIRYSYPTYAAPFYNVVFTLLLLTTINLAVRKKFPRHAFSRVEMITVYVMLSVSSGVCSHEFMAVLVSIMGHASYFATPQNNWNELFERNLPNWLVVRDRVSLHNFYAGDSSLYLPENFIPWLVPAFWWCVFCAILLLTTLCLNSILRKQWVENERLTFPIVTLPLEMTHESGALFRNKHMWLGFAISGAITVLAGINYLYPSVPAPRITRFNVGALITTPPWNAMGHISVAYYFWAIGIAYLMPLELSISCWLFYWFNKVQLVLWTILGFRDIISRGGGFDQSFPFQVSQSYGAYIGFFVISMWSSRHYLARVWRTAFKGTKEEDESREPVSYRVAILGAAAGLILLCCFARAMGMSLYLIPLYLVLYFIVVILISRIRAELGFPTHDASSMGPNKLMLTVIPSDNITRADLSSLGLFAWTYRDFSSNPSPHMMEAFKMVEHDRGVAKQMFGAIALAGVLAMPIGFWMLLHAYFHYGGATARMEMWASKFGQEIWGLTSNCISQPPGTNPMAATFVGLGFGIAMLLGWLRLRFFSFPLHPLAYAMASSWGVSQLWMPILIGSVAKLILLKFGGLRSYRAGIPFFLGLILGEITIGSLWTIIGIVLGIPTYDFWPGKYNQILGSM